MQHHFATGGDGKFRNGTPRRSRLTAEMVRAWGSNDEGHFLLVETNGEPMLVTPLGHRREGRLLTIKINPAGARPPHAPLGDLEWDADRTADNESRTNQDCRAAIIRLS